MFPYDRLYCAPPIRHGTGFAVTNVTIFWYSPFPAAVSSMATRAVAESAHLELRSAANPNGTHSRQSRR